MNSSQTEAKAEFDKAQGRLFEALNLGKVRPADSELAALRQQVATTQARCRELGLEVETLYELGIRMQAEAELRIKDYAEQQKLIRPILTRKLRLIASAVIGVIAAVMCFEYSPAWAAFLGGVVWLTSYLGVAQVLPTPGIRVGRLAYRDGVTHIRHWPDQSDDHNDFLLACRWEHAKGDQGWVRTR